MSEATGAKLDTLIYEVSARQKVGDVCMLALLTPIFLIMLGLLVAIPAAVVIYGAGLGSGDPQRARMLVGAAAAGALPLALLALRRQVCWRFTLLPDRLQLGSGWLGREVAYDQLRLIRAGEHGLGRLQRSHRRRDAAVPLQIELASRPRRCRIWLAPEAAAAALQALHERSDAPALRLDGKELLPRDPQRRVAGVARLARLHRAIGVPLVIGGVALLGMLVAVTVDRLLHDGLFWSELGDMLEVGAGGVGALAIGLAALRRARRLARRAHAAPLPAAAKRARRR